MTAFREEGRIVVVVPEHLSGRQRRELGPGRVERCLAREARRRAPRADEEITRRARELYGEFVAPHAEGGSPTFGVRWVSTMQHRWGSCTRSTGEIRISDRLQVMPAWVVDYVLLHEVAHLVEREHNDRFWAIVNAHPGTPRARGFLEGVDFAHREGAG